MVNINPIGNPALRFPEFANDWQENELGDICEIKMGTSPSSKNYNTNKNGKPLFQGNADIKNRKTSPRIYTSEITQECNANDILMCVRAPVGDISLCFHNGVIGRGMCLIRSNNFLFFYQILLNNEKKWVKYSQGSTFKAVNSKDIKKIKIKFPSTEEQNKIGLFLSAVDKRIDLLQQKHDKFIQYKNGLMQVLFPRKGQTNPSIRLKDKNDKPFTTNWQENELGDVISYEQPNKYIVDSTEYNNMYNIPVLTAGKSFILGYTNEKHGIYNKGECIIFDDFTTNLHYVYFPFKVKSSAIKLLTLKNNEDNIKTIYELIKRIHYPTPEHKRYWISEYTNLYIRLPQSEEQNKIGLFLSAVDKSIKNTSNQINQSKLYKKSLMQKMFI